VLRVTVYNGPDDPERIEILEASTRPAQKRPREVTLAPALTAPRTRPRRDHLTLDLGARHQPFRGLELDVADPVFFRGVVVEARVDPPSPREGAPGLPGLALSGRVRALSLR
jgi:hypothetical protein